MKTMLNAGGGYIPKGAKNVEVAKDFMGSVTSRAVCHASCA